MITVGIIGYGYWGPNIVRNLARHKGFAISWICDVNKSVLTEAARVFPGIKTTQTASDLLKDGELDAVVLATPPSTHFLLASGALKAGKHVLVEKPLTESVREAKLLVALSKKMRRTLMVDHTFIYTPAVVLLKKIIDSGELGDVYAIDSVRTNLGILQKDSNVISDLAVHDFSIIDYLFGKTAKSISAHGITDLKIRQETVAYISTQYAGGLFLHSHVSWLSPAKIRRMIFTGTKKMLIFDDIEPSEKIKIYDKGVSVVKDAKEFRQMKIGYRNGDVTIPYLPLEEGLWGMVKEFESSIREHRPAITDGVQGLRVVSYIAAATRSMRNGGRKILL